ncbi:hypothetical protein HanRHA438_Chr01g0029521 [Helianthus annuus]|nr:hypothetical protein HanRHA438_Chr01g0029521 [Helianthus annuus]
MNLRPNYFRTLCGKSFKHHFLFWFALSGSGFSGSPVSISSSSRNVSSDGSRKSAKP